MKALKHPLTELAVHDIYVDNLISEVNKTGEAIQFYKEIKQPFKKASMNMRDWGSNRTEFLKNVPVDDRNQPVISKVVEMSALARERLNKEQSDVKEDIAPFNISEVKYSSMKKLLCITAYARRFIDKVLKKTNKSGNLIVNPNLGGLLRGSFLGGGKGGKITPCLKLVRIMLESSNLARKYTPVCSFRKYTF